MQYTDYISQYHARHEREQQLVAKYNQRPAGQRVQNLWLHQVDKTVSHAITGKELFQVIAGLLGAGFVLLLSIWL